MHFMPKIVRDRRGLFTSHSFMPKWCMCIDIFHQTIFPCLPRVVGIAVVAFVVPRFLFKPSRNSPSLKFYNVLRLLRHSGYICLLISCHISKRVIPNWQLHHARLNDRQVQKSDRMKINSDRQSGADKFGSTSITLDHCKT